MQMLCKASSVLHDVQCPICGDGFLVYWTRNREVTRAEQRDALQQVLREQHRMMHPGEEHGLSFQVPDTPMPPPRRMRLSQAVTAQAATAVAV